MTTTDYGRITDDGLEELRGRIGVEFPGPTPWFRTATEDTIRNYAHGMGDDNPLWTDPDYARATTWGRLLAPPSILYAMDRVITGYVGGLPGVHAMYAGASWEWDRPIGEGDRLVGTSKLVDLVAKETRFAGRAIQQIYETVFRDDDGQTVATVRSWCFRTERGRARKTAAYESGAYDTDSRLATYTPEDIERIAERYAAEVRRGSERRSWGSVKVGDNLDPILKGPLTVTDIIAYYEGRGALYVVPHRLRFALFERHPKLGIRNGQGVPEPPVRVHWDTEYARAVGVPAAYDSGPERIAWLLQVVTDWAGDDARVVGANCRVRRHNLLGDLTECTGTVRATRIVDGAGHVVIDVWAENQRGQRTAEGSVTVVLPVDEVAS